MGQNDEIKREAYYIWLHEGCIDGQDCEHWTRAEAICKKQQFSECGNTAKEAVTMAGVLITPLPKQVVLLHPYDQPSPTD